MADIDIRVLFQDVEAQAEIKRLQNSLRELQAEQARVRGTTFDAFSRAQIQPQIDALNSLSASVQKAIADTTVLGATVGGTEQNLAGFINSMVGADRQIKSAASSARVLASGIGALAEEDSRAREAAMAAQAAQAAAAAATRQRAADSFAAAAAERERIAATLAADAASFTGYGRSAGARAQPRSRTATDDVDALAQQLLNLQTIAAATKMSPEFAEAAKKQVDELHQKIESLIASGAQGSSVALQTVLKQQADAAKASFYAQDIQTAGQLYASIKANERAMQESVASIKAASAAWDAAHKAGTRAAEEVGHAWLSNSRVIQHGFGIIDSAARGARGQMMSSIGAMIRDSGLATAAIGAMSAAWAPFAVAGVGALVAVGYAAEQALQRFRSISDAAGTLALGGMGDQTRVLGEQFDRLQARTDEYAGTIKSVQGAMAALPPAAQGVAESLYSDAIAIAAFKKEDPAKVFAELAKAATAHGPEGVARWREEYYKLQGVTDEAGRTIHEATAQAGGLSQQFSAAAHFGDQFTASIRKAGEESRTAQTNWFSTSAALTSMADAGFGASAVFDGFSKQLEKAITPAADVAATTTQFTAAIRDQNIAVSAANVELGKRVELIRQLTLVTEASKRLATEEGVITPEGRAAEAARRERSAEAQRSKPTAAEDEQHQLVLAHIQAEAQARHSDLQAQAAAAKQRADEEERFTRERLVAGGMAPDDAAQLAQSYSRVQALRNAQAEAERRVADQSVEINRIGLEAKIADEHVGTQARIDAMNQIIAMDRKEVEEGRKAPTVVAQDEVRLANLKTQLRNRSFQEARDNARAEIELAKGNVDQILAAYAKLRGVAMATGQPGAVQAQISREMVRDLESAQGQAFAKVSEYNSSVERQDNLRINAFKAQLAVQMAQHSLSKDQMAAKEAQFTTQVMAEEEKRVEAELKGDDLTEQQKIRLYDHLAELYQKDAERQQQAQEKLTQAIEAENEKRLRSFKNMFDSIGSATEKLGEAAIFRTQTRAQAFRQFGQSIAKSLFEEVTHLGSQFAGKQLAGVLGVKTEGMTDTGIGSVLSRALGDALGLTKESTGQEALKGVADKWQKAVDAQNEASKLQQSAGQELQKAAQALQQAGASRGMSTGYGREGAAAPSMGVAGAEALSDSPSSQASAAVSYAMEHTGEKLKDYCTILVNESLEKAGVRGSGSGLASSFKSYGTPVAPGDVQKGDVFYAPPSGWGDTGHVGFATGPIENGRVPVFSSHLQGAASNPAGSEYRDVSNLIFRRPDYAVFGGTSQQPFKVDPASVAMGVQQGQKESAQAIQTAVDAGAQQGNVGLVSSNQQLTTSTTDLSNRYPQVYQATDAEKQAVNQNTQALNGVSQKLTTQGTGGIGGIGALSGIATNDNSSHGVSSSLSLLTQGLGIAASAAAIFGRQLSPAGRALLGTVGILTQLMSFGKNLSSSFDIFGSTTKAVSSTLQAGQTSQLALNTATALGQTAQIADVAAVNADAAAMTAHAAAAGTSSITSGISSSGGGLLSGIGNLFGGGSKGISDVATNTAQTAANTGTGGALSNIFSSGLGSIGLLGLAGGAIAALPSIIKAGTDFVGPKGLGGSVGGNVLLAGIGLSFLGLERGGVISAAEGTVLPPSPGLFGVNDGKGGRLIIAHPGEAIVPAAQTPAVLDFLQMRGTRLASAAAGMLVGGSGGSGLDAIFDPSRVVLPHDIGETQLHMANVGEGRSTPAAANNNSSTNATFNYTANVTGYHPYSSRASFEGMLRQHGSTFETWVDNAVRNGTFGR